MHYRFLKRGLLLGVSSLVLVACGNGEESDLDNEPREENIENND